MRPMVYSNNSLDSTFRNPYMGNACSFASTTLLTPETINNTNTSHNFQFAFRKELDTSDKRSDSSSSYSSSGSNDLDKLTEADSPSSPPLAGVGVPASDQLAQLDTRR